MKWGHLELHRDLFLWVSTVNEKEKYKENVDTSPEMQEYKYCLPPPALNVFSFKFNSEIPMLLRFQSDNPLIINITYQLFLSQLF